MIRFSTPKLVRELVAEKILDDSTDSTFSDKTSPKRDDIWTDAACHIIRTRQPNFLLLHLLLVDGIHHRFGPQSPEGYKALGQADQHIGQLFETLEKSGLRESTTVFIVADHGFERVTKHIVSSVILRQEGWLEFDGAAKKSRVQIISEGGTAMVYFNYLKTKEMDRRKVIALFKNQEGVERILEPKDFANYGYPSPKNNPQMADLVLAAKPGYGFSGLTTGNESIVPTRAGGSGSHGYLSTNPKMNAVFIVAGRGIVKGKKIGVVENIDVAPTAAFLLGQKFPGADGKVLQEILTGR